jgi:outer membrane receptor protein involved in Fe transport
VLPFDHRTGPGRRHPDATASAAAVKFSASARTTFPSRPGADTGRGCRAMGGDIVQATTCRIYIIHRAWRSRHGRTAAREQGTGTSADDGIAEIMVTATKQATAPQSIAIAITAVTSDALEQRSITNTADEHWLSRDLHRLLRCHTSSDPTFWWRRAASFSSLSLQQSASQAP